MRILKEPKNALVKQYQRLLELDGVKLKFDDDALQEMAHQAIERNTGARGLRSIIEATMRDVMYDIPSHDDITQVTITRDTVLGKKGPAIKRKKEKTTSKTTTKD